jgi:hypothetical protein
VGALLLLFTIVVAFFIVTTPMQAGVLDASQTFFLPKRAQLPCFPRTLIAIARQSKQG